MKLDARLTMRRTFNFNVEKIYMELNNFAVLVQYYWIVFLPLCQSIFSLGGAQSQMVELLSLSTRDLNLGAVCLEFKCSACDRVHVSSRPKENVLTFVFLNHGSICNVAHSRVT